MEHASFDNITIFDGGDRLKKKDSKLIVIIVICAVATGAEVVAYGPFSNSYLYQPYNSNFDFGTGDFSIMFWVKSTKDSFLQSTGPRVDDNEWHHRFIGVLDGTSKKIYGLWYVLLELTVNGTVNGQKGFFRKYQQM